MYKTSGEALELVNGLKSELKGESAVDIVVCPPFTAIAKVADALKGSNIGYGAQDMYWEEEGAFTGEVAPKMITDLGCGYCIIGHSERRTYFHETNDTVNKKVKAALKHGLTPIVCVGERLEERDSGKTFDVVKDHVEGGLSGLTKEDALKVVIAYEPVWAIGTGRTATPEQAQEVHARLRSQLAAAGAKDVPVLYGGSVKAANAAALYAMPDVDGGLVGGASLDANELLAIAGS